MWATALATSTSSFQMYYLENFGAWRARWGTYLVARRPLVSERKNMRANASRKPWAEKDSELVKEAKRLMRRSTKDAGALCATSLRSWPLGYVNEDAAQFSAPSVQSMLHKD